MPHITKASILLNLTSRYFLYPGSNGNTKLSEDTHDPVSTQLNDNSNEDNELSGNVNYNPTLDSTEKGSHEKGNVILDKW